MAQEQQPDFQINLLLSDFNTRLRDTEERNRILKERILLIGQNLISSRDETEKEVQELKRENSQLKKEVERLKSISQGLLAETGKFVKRDEILLVEKMLRDFQPLEFARMKDVEEMIQKLGLKTHDASNKREKEETKHEIKHGHNRKSH